MKWELVGDLSGDFYLQIASETFYIFTKFAFKDLINHIYHGKDLNRLRATACYKFKEILEKEGGFVDVYFSGTKEDEKAIKDATGATPRCYPTEWNGDTGKCFYTGKEGARRAIFAKSY